MKPRPKRRLPWWAYLLDNVVPVAYLLALALLVAMAYRLAVWWFFGVRIWF